MVVELVTAMRYPPIPPYKGSAIDGDVVKGFGAPPTRQPGKLIAPAHTRGRTDPLR